MTLVLHAAALSDVGLVRSGNEDAGFAGRQLLVVADGMGGHVAGEVASSVAVATMAELDEFIPPDIEPLSGSDQKEAADTSEEKQATPDLLQRMRQMIVLANDHIRDQVEANPDLRGMGCTMTTLLYDGQRLGLAHVGDSRCYLLRRGNLEQLTTDHTFVQTLIDEGQITAAEAAVHPQRSLITRALDGREDVEPDLELRDIRRGDRYLVCSDGLSGVVPYEVIHDVLLNEPHPQDVCEELVNLALDGGGPDNITCVVADVIEKPENFQPTPAMVGAATQRQNSPPVHDPTQEFPAIEEEVASDAVTPPPPRGHLYFTEAPRKFKAKKPGKRRWRWVAALSVLVALAAMVGVVAYTGSQRKYYVGYVNVTIVTAAASGAEAASSSYSEDRIAIYRGVPNRLPFLTLSRVEKTSEVPLASLPLSVREKVRNTITTNSLDEAQKTLDNLSELARLCAPWAHSTPSSLEQPGSPNPPALPARPTECAGLGEPVPENSANTLVTPPSTGASRPGAP